MPATEFEPYEFTDEELTALALAADPDAPLDPEAVEFMEPGADYGLPGWYMPPAQRQVRNRRHRIARITIAASLLGINAMGLCVTYGQIVLA